MCRTAVLLIEDGRPTTVMNDAMVTPGGKGTSSDILGERPALPAMPSEYDLPRTIPERV